MTIREEIRRLKEDIYECQIHALSHRPATLRLAGAFSAFLLEKPIRIEEESLAGLFLFSGCQYSNPGSLEQEFACWKQDHGEEHELLRAFLKGEQEGYYNRSPGGHIVAGYEKLLHVGVGGILDELQSAETVKGDTPFYRAGVLCMEAFSRYILRCGKEAEENGLNETAKNCYAVFLDPPAHFAQALQLLCLAHEAVTLEQLSGSLSLGRIDHLLAPYYDRDVQEGLITFEQAKEMICAFWRLLSATPRAFQNITLGGYSSETGYFCHDLTRICLQASRLVAKDQPLVSLRVHPDMPEILWKEALDTLATGIGFPALFQDEICIRAMEKSGISRQDAENYAIVGCVELTVPGKEYANTEALRINWARVLEEYCSQVASGLLEEPAGFTEFLNGYLEQLGKRLKSATRANDLLNTNYSAHWPAPFLSCLMDGCVQRGKDVTDNGSRYSLQSINACGMANTVDSLMAIREIIYQKKQLSLKEYLGIVEHNFEEYEPLRKSVWENCMRFGSDLQAVELMKTISDYFLGKCRKLARDRNKTYQVGYYSVDTHGILGERTGALPDGRPAGKALANGFSPVQGTEKYGPTQVLSSVACAVDHTDFSNGMVLDLKFQPAYFQKEEKRGAVRALFESYFDLGGMEIQCNVVDRETLLAAQRHPAEYKNLIVRVSGFSAYFVTLSPEVQEEIITRTGWGNR